MSPSWLPDPIDIPIPAELKDKAAPVVAVQCVAYGDGRQRKVGQAALREFLERTQSAGRSFLEVTQEAEEQHKANRDKAKQELDPVERALSDHEPHLVCQYCVRQLNGVPVTFEQVSEWLDHANSEVLKHIATVLLRAEDLIEETEAAAGEG